MIASSTWGWTQNFTLCLHSGRSCHAFRCSQKWKSGCHQHTDNACLRLDEGYAWDQRKLAAKLKELEDRMDMNDQNVVAIMDVLRDHLRPPPPDKKKIGFHTDWPWCMSYPWLIMALSLWDKKKNIPSNLVNHSVNNRVCLYSFVTLNYWTVGLWRCLRKYLYF